MIIHVIIILINYSYKLKNLMEVFIYLINIIQFMRVNQKIILYLKFVILLLTFQLILNQIILKDHITIYFIPITWFLAHYSPLSFAINFTLDLNTWFLIIFKSLIHFIIILFTVIVIVHFFGTIFYCFLFLLTSMI